MGGLAERAYQQNSASGKPINSMVSMGSPHHGAFHLVRLAAAGILAGTTGFRGFPALDVLLSVWSPGTADLLDYSDTVCAVSATFSGNPTMCRMNQDATSGPVRRLSLIAGTDSKRIGDLFGGIDEVTDQEGYAEVVEEVQAEIEQKGLLDLVAEGANELLSQGVALNGCVPSDAIVCLWSAHARAGIFGGPVPALRDKIAWTSKRGFNHGNAGTADQPVRNFMDLDVFPRLTDSFDARLQAPIVLNPPTEHSTGSIAADIRVEYNAFTNSLFGVVPVVYAYYLKRTSGGSITGPGKWKILSGADEEGMPDLQEAQETAGSSRGPEIVIEFLISTTIPFEAEDEKFLGATIVIEGIGPRDQTVPLEPSSSFSIPPPPQP